MDPAVLRLRAREPVELGDLAVDLDRRLNQPGEPRVYVVAVAADRQLSFTCETWGPILRSRVDDALDAALGADWGSVLERVG